MHWRIKEIARYTVHLLVIDDIVTETVYLNERSEYYESLGENKTK